MEGKANLISFIPYDIITLFCKVILEVASQLDYARKHGSKYDIITLFCKGILEVKKQ